MRKLLCISVCMAVLTGCNGLTEASLNEGAPDTVPVVMLPPESGNKTYMLDTEASSLGWRGRKVVGEHYGTLVLKRGALQVTNGTIAGGDFEIDMDSIVCLDLTNQASNERLVNHLRSDDFFSVDAHPTALFVLTGAVPRQQGESNMEIAGNLTIKSITHPVAFPARVWHEDGVLRATGVMTFDRTKWDIRFRSGSFFENLGDNMIYDDIEIRLDLATLP